MKFKRLFFAVIVLAATFISGCTNSETQKYVENGENLNVHSSIANENSTSDESISEAEGADSIVSDTDDANSTDETDAFSGESGEVMSGTNEILVVYYSRSGTTERVANIMSEKLGADIYKIEVVKEYPTDMYETDDIAKEERKTGNLPELKGELPDVSKYDTVLIGGPVWSHTLSTPLMSYLEQTELSGKKVAGFWTDLGVDDDYAVNRDGHTYNGACALD